MYRMIGRQSLSADANTSPDHAVDKMFKRFDRNSDGSISLDEFIQAAKWDRSIMRLLQIDPLQSQKK